jgi:hypothetical protein
MLSRTDISPGKNLSGLRSLVHRRLVCFLLLSVFLFSQTASLLHTLEFDHANHQENGNCDWCLHAKTLKNVSPLVELGQPVVRVLVQRLVIQLADVHSTYFLAAYHSRAPPTLFLA